MAADTLPGLLRLLAPIAMGAAASAAWYASMNSIEPTTPGSWT
jgi:hypothetical protein